MNGLTAAWLAEIIVIAYRGAKTGSTQNNPIPHLALPSEYASTIIIYGALSFIPSEGQKFATTMGWGLVVATVLNLWTPGKVVKGVQTETVSPTATNTTKSVNVDTRVSQEGK